MKLKVRSRLSRAAHPLVNLASAHLGPDVEQIRLARGNGFDSG